MIAPKPKKVPDLMRLEAELLRDALGAAAHDLGGVASALALRIDTLGPAIAPEDRRALSAIADEARTLGRHLRQLRGPTGGDALAPSRPATLLTWWPLVERFGRALLGRGLALEASLDDAPISPAQAHALTYAILGIAMDLRARAMPRPARVSLVASHVDGTVELRMRLTGPDEVPLDMVTAADPWGRYALDRATQGGVDIAWEDRDVLFRIPAPRS